MQRRALLAGLACAGLTALAWPLAAAADATLSARDQADLQRVQAYLNGIQTLKARFQQIAPNGSVTTGTVWLERPGRMRFQYDAPAPFLLVAGHGLVVFHDSQLGQTSNIPIDRTPLGILLRANMTLSGDVTVISVVRYPGQLQISLYRTAAASEGSLTLVFADNPLALRSWTVIDAQRQETRVALFDVELGGKFDQSLFTFIDPKFFGSGALPQ